MILMYHHVAPLDVVPRERDSGWGWLHTPAALEFHVRELRRRHRRIVSLEEYVSTIEESGHEPDQAVVLTFDDGWVDNYDYALPVLQKLGVPATFFLTTEHLSASEQDPRRIPPEAIRELHSLGYTIGGHTRSHAILTRVDPSSLREEIEGCRSDLEALIDAPVSYFAYPGGAFNSETSAAVASAGFRAACSSLGPASNDTSALMWLFRDVLSSDMRGLRDRYRLSPTARRLLAFRVRRRLERRLASAQTPVSA